MGPDPFLQILGEFRRYMIVTLNLYVFSGFSTRVLDFLGFFSNFRRCGHPAITMYFMDRNLDFIFNYIFDLNYKTFLCMKKAKFLLFPENNFDA